MRPILFLGADYLQRIVDPSLSAAEREAQEAALVLRCRKDADGNMGKEIADAFGTLKIEEMRSLTPELLIWFLNWVQVIDPEWLSLKNKAFLRDVWRTFPHLVLRARALEMLLDIVASYEKDDEAREIRELFMEALQNRESGDQDDEKEHGDFGAYDLIDTVLARQDRRSIELLVKALGDRYVDRFAGHIRERAHDVGDQFSMFIEKLLCR